MATATDPFGLGAIDPASPIGLILTQAAANRIDQRTPLGSLTFSGPGRTAADLQVSPDIMKLLNERIRASTAATSALDFTDFDTARKAAEESAFTKSASRIREFFDPLEQNLERKFTAQGLFPGSEGFNTVFKTQVADPRNRAISEANLDAVRAGIAELSALGNLNTQRAGIANQLATGDVAGASLRDFFAPPALDVLGPENLRFNQNLAGQNAALKQDEQKLLENMARRQGLTQIATALISGAGAAGGIAQFFGYKSGLDLVKDIALKGKDLVTGIYDLIAGTTGQTGPEAIQAAKEFASLYSSNLGESGASLIDTGFDLGGAANANGNLVGDLIYNPTTGTFEPFGKATGGSSHIEAAFFQDVPADLVPPELAAELPAAFSAATLGDTAAAFGAADAAVSTGAASAADAGVLASLGGGAGLGLIGGGAAIIGGLIARKQMRKVRATPQEAGIGNARRVVDILSQPEFGLDVSVRQQGSGPNLTYELKGRDSDYVREVLDTGRWGGDTHATLFDHPDPRIRDSYRRYIRRVDQEAGGGD